MVSCKSTAARSFIINTEQLTALGLKAPKGKGPHILFYDIETAPALVYVWRQYDTNVIDTVADWYMLSFAYAWGSWGETKTDYVGMNQDPDWTPDPLNNDDRYVAERLHALFDSADLVVAHNGDKFDERKANARFMYHGLTPPSPYNNVDTKKASSRKFGNYSNALNEIARQHGLGAKLPHTGFEVWKGCMSGDKQQWKVMEQYNRHDVVLLRKVYGLMLPWIERHPNLGFWEKGKTACTNCGSTSLMRRGVHRTMVSEFQTFQCNKCGKYSRARKRNTQAFGNGVKVT